MSNNKYLNVPFAEKDEAKSLGAKWNPTIKKWYAPKGSNIEKFSKWLPEFELSSVQVIEKPSETTDEFWLYAENKNGNYNEYNKNTGKWLLFVPREQIDKAWAVIKHSTEQGSLTGQAKVSTAAESPNTTSNESHVICVYTYDWTDEKEVLSVREKLRTLGFTNKIPYKADQDTLSGKYSNKGNKNISKYYE